MKTIVVLQARMESTRLPGKVLMELGDTTVIESQMSRVARANVDEFWLATSSRPADSILRDVAMNQGWEFYQGSSDNVLARFLGVLNESPADYVVRLTGDNPFTNASMIDRLVGHILTSSSVDWVGEAEPRSYPIGLVPEVVSSSALRATATVPESAQLRQYTHVTTMVRSGPTARVIPPPANFDCDPSWRLTVDNHEDIVMARALVDALGPRWIEADFGQICDCLRRNPQIVEINRHMEQKKWADG